MNDGPVLSGPAYELSRDETSRCLANENGEQENTGPNGGIRQGNLEELRKVEQRRVEYHAIDEHGDIYTGHRHMLEDVHRHYGKPRTLPLPEAEKRDHKEARE